MSADRGIEVGGPCYTFQGANIALIHGFKEYCAIMFVKGSLLPDPQGILIQLFHGPQTVRYPYSTGLEIYAAYSEK
ncbi:DUF1801 domain-containing protein [Paenibacillus sp. FSL R7-0312]|uniref:DUF1801 domain-containing protein n=1 Tax=Paenibacillus sp. FSL R7-0312 TaxID=2921682 RepID=UPI004040BC35